MQATEYPHVVCDHHCPVITDHSGVTVLWLFPVTIPVFQCSSLSPLSLFLYPLLAACAACAAWSWLVAASLYLPKHQLSAQAAQASAGMLPGRRCWPGLTTCPTHARDTGGDNKVVIAKFLHFIINVVWHCIGIIRWIECFELVVDKIFYGQPKSIFLVPNLDLSIQDSGTWDLGWTLIGNLTQGWDYNNNVPGNDV